MRTISSVIFLPFLIILIFLITSVNGFSDEWVEYGRSPKGDVFLYNKVSIKLMRKNVVQVWYDRVYSDRSRETNIRDRKKDGLSTEGYDKLSHTLCLIEIDCEKYRFQVLSCVDYDKDSSVINNFSTNKRIRRYIPPDSMVDNLRKKVCE